MLENGRIDVSEETDVQKVNALPECIVCCYWYFLEIKFTYQTKVCNDYHDLMQRSMSFNDVAIASISNVLMMLQLNSFFSTWLKMKP